MPEYYLTGHCVETATDHQILIDMLTHMKQIVDGFELRKLKKLGGLARARYGVARAFGHRKGYHDLLLWHPSVVVGGLLDGFIPVHDLKPQFGLRSVTMSYRLLLLGKESKTDDRLGGNSTMANEIHVNVKRKSEVTVEMELSGNAFLNLLSDMGCRREGFGGQMLQMIVNRWGSRGVEYGLYDRDDGQKGEFYRIVHLIDSVVSRQSGEEGRWVKGMNTVQDLPSWINPPSPNNNVWKQW